MRYRRDRLRAYAGVRVTEAHLIKNFGATYLQPDNLEPKDVVIFWGDWSKADGWRHQGPVPHKRYRKLFKRAGYNVLLVRERWTSQTCSRCHARPLVQFKRYANPRPPYPGLPVTAHGLLKCTSGCNRIWNRDMNAAINILNIGLSHVDHDVRPNYLL
jgi:hypothetical protein